MPQAHILSNKTYMMYLNSEGYGYAKLGDININRFFAYGRGEKGGFFVFVTDDKTGETFPATLLHNSPAPKSGSVAFYNDKALFTRCDDRLDTKTQITVCPGRECTDTRGYYHKSRAAGTDADADVLHGGDSHEKAGRRGAPGVFRPVCQHTV